MIPVCFAGDAPGWLAPTPTSDAVYFSPKIKFGSGSRFGGWALAVYYSVTGHPPSPLIFRIMGLGMV
jgi:hypothetical protein